MLLDLPDHDSVVVEHRVRAERLVERADLLVWVVDPQKYADAALHERYLRPLAGHGSVVVLVLNQVDRLTPADADACLADLRRLAAEDGLADARVLGSRPAPARAWTSCGGCSRTPRPGVVRPTTPAPARRATAKAAPATRTPRRTTARSAEPEKPPAVCPTCFTVLPATGICDECG
nr:hypothetical protein [Cellulosimicrobium sp. MM]